MSLFFRSGRPVDGRIAPSDLIPARPAVGVTQVAVKADEALQKVAVFASANLISSVAGMLPVDVFQGEGKRRREVDAPALLVDPGGEGYGVGDWLYQQLMAGCMRGNMVARILEVDRFGTPSILEPVHPDDVRVVRVKKTGRAAWLVNDKEVPRSSLWHYRRYPMPGSVLGMSPIENHAYTIGVAIHAERFGGQWFADGGHPSGVLESDQQVDQPTAQLIKSRFVNALRGSREPAVLGAGLKYKPISVKANESQFLETMKYGAGECCRIFGPGVAETLGYETGGSYQYQNTEQRALHLLTYAVDPWLVGLERALSALLPVGQFVKFNRAALLRSDTLSRYRAHEIMLRNRVRTPNEVRDDEEWQPVAWGSEPNTYTHSAGAVDIEGDTDGPSS